MAKKLTKDTLENMVLEAINNDAKIMDEIISWKKWFAGDSQPPRGVSGGSYKLPAGYGAVSDKEEVLNFISSTRKIPNDIKEKMIDLIMAVPSAKAAAVPKAKAKITPTDVAIAGGTEADVEAVSAAMEPTPKSLEAPGFPDDFGQKSPELKMSKDKEEKLAPWRRAGGRGGYRNVEEQIEQLVSQVLAEMSKEKPTAKKKEDLEGLEKHYGEEMRAGIKGKHSHKSRMAALQAAKKAAK